ncbi:MAG: L-rhamnose mutarotase [Planctomycetota bacterium]
MRRIGQVIGIKPERLNEYKQIHAAVWPEILDAITRAGIRNYSIYHYQGKLFAYMEYHGPDGEFDARMKELANAPRMREWWNVTEPMQIPESTRSTGAWWTDIEEVFHHDS